MARQSRRLHRHPKCRDCGRRYPRDVFLPDDTGSLTTRICHLCRTKRSELHDWAYALYRWVYLIAPQADIGANLTADAIRILAQLQNTACGVTGTALTLPDVEFAHGVTIQGWSERADLTATQRRTLPALMRVSICAKWELGNVILVTQRVADMFKGFGDLMEAQSFCREFIVREVVAMSPELIYERMMIDDKQQEI